jgi:hypothetical protein
MSWSKGSDVQRELARKHARQLMTAFDEVMKRETPEPVAVGAAVADLLSGYLVGWVDPESDDATAELRARRLQEILVVAGRLMAKKEKARLAKLAAENYGGAKDGREASDGV